MKIQKIILGVLSSGSHDEDNDILTLLPIVIVPVKFVWTGRVQILDIIPSDKIKIWFAENIDLTDAHSVLNFTDWPGNPNNNLPFEQDPPPVIFYTLNYISNWNNNPGGFMNVNILNGWSDSVGWIKPTVNTGDWLIIIPSGNFLLHLLLGFFIDFNGILNPLLPIQDFRINVPHFWNPAYKYITAKNLFYGGTTAENRSIYSLLNYSSSTISDYYPTEKSKIEANCGQIDSCIYNHIKKFLPSRFQDTMGTGWLVEQLAIKNNIPSNSHKYDPSSKNILENSDVMAVLFLESILNSDFRNADSYNTPSEYIRD